MFSVTDSHDNKMRKSGFSTGSNIMDEHLSKIFFIRYPKENPDAAKNI